MSSYISHAKHPTIGTWYEVLMIDDFYGPHEYGIKFPSGEVFRDKGIEVSSECRCNNQEGVKHGSLITL